MVIGYVRLLMEDPHGAVEFFEGLGFMSSGEDPVCIRPRDGDCIIYIERKGELPPRDNYIYHVAIVLGSRRQLATLARRVRIEGAADHLVSESIYVRGPGGVGLEFYVDKPRSEWIINDDGTVAMDTRPLDLEGLLEEPDVENPVDGARIGHIHLRVSRVSVGVDFYESLGFRVTGRYMGAVFMALGDYHHHIALNNWPVPGPRRGNGLLGFSIDHGDTTGTTIRDPYGFEITLRGKTGESYQ